MRLGVNKQSLKIQTRWSMLDCAATPIHLDICPNMGIQKIRIAQLLTMLAPKSFYLPHSFHTYTRDKENFSFKQVMARSKNVVKQGKTHM